MATCDGAGRLSLWNLGERRKIGSVPLGLEESHAIAFTDETNGVAVGSKDIVGWRLGQTGVELLRTRRGARGGLKSLKFCDGLRAVGVTDCAEGEVRAYSLLNECFSQSYSKKVDSKSTT